MGRSLNVKSVMKVAESADHDVMTRCHIRIQEEVWDGEGHNVVFSLLKRK